jgi:hypothetical protein
VNAKIREVLNFLVIVAFSFGKGANEERARAILHDNLDITLLTVKELLKNQSQNTIEPKP